MRWWGMGHRDMMKAAWVGHGGGQSQGTCGYALVRHEVCGGKAKGRSVGHGAQKGWLWGGVQGQ